MKADVCGKWVMVCVEMMAQMSVMERIVAVFQMKAIKENPHYNPDRLEYEEEFQTSTTRTTGTTTTTPITTPRELFPSTPSWSSDIWGMEDHTQFPTELEDGWYSKEWMRRAG